MKDDTLGTGPQFVAKGIKAMSDFNEALAKLNAVLNLDGKAAIQSLRELADRGYESPQDFIWEEPNA